MFFAGGADLNSCSSDSETIDESNSLYYGGVTEICPGTNYSLNPTWHGDTPSSFEIADVRRDGLHSDASCFSVNAETGVFSILGSSGVETGSYQIDISCVFGSTRRTFKDAVTVDMMKPVPDNIYVDPPLISVSLSDLLSADESSLPTAQVLARGTDHVTITKYIISSVWLNGELFSDWKECFDISSSGIISIKSSEKIQSGVYVFDLRLTSYATGTEAEEGLFKKALKLVVNSAPLSLSYTPSARKVERGYGTKSVKPAFEGSTGGLKYAIKSVTPDNNVGITVDEATGVIRFPEGAQAEIGSAYTVSLTVSNEFGSADFDDVYTWNVVDYITPISQFEYDDVGELYEGMSINNPVKGIIGDNPSFEFENLPEGLSSLRIDSGTGTVSLAKGVELPRGEYVITVKASNDKNSMTASFKLKISANPFKFTYVRWGNNLGLEPEEQYGNQFRIKFGEPDIIVPVSSSDIPAGYPVSYSFQPCWTYQSAPMGVTIDENTGQLTIKAQDKGIDDANAVRAHAGIITVTVGGDNEVAVSKKFPLFVDQSGYRAGYNIEFTPFAFRVNPKTGGISTSPKITTDKGEEIPADASHFSMDFRRGFVYYNLNGPASHENTVASYCGQINNGINKNLLIPIWTKFFNSIGSAINVGSSAPVSYWQTYLNGRLGFTACYFDPNQNIKLVVQPEKFLDDNGYADGFFMATAAFQLGNDPIAYTGTAMNCIPIIVWLDPSFNN